MDTTDRSLPVDEMVDSLTDLIEAAQRLPFPLRRALPLSDYIDSLQAAKEALIDASKALDRAGLGR